MHNAHTNSQCPIHWDGSPFSFEQNDPSSLEILKKSIEEDISLVFSVIELKEIKIIADEDYYSVTIQIFYSVFSSLNEFVEFNMPL